MMKRVFSIFMAFSFLLIVSQQALIIVHFKLNQYVIEQKFCINKNNVELQCQGICYLKKELQQTEKNDLETIGFYKSFEMILVAYFEFEAKIKQKVMLFKSSVYREVFPLDPYLQVLIQPPDCFWLTILNTHYI